MGEGERRAPVAVPDLHGRLDLLRPVLEAYPDREFVFLGDYIDRGPDSRAVLRAVLELERDGRAALLLGNHELMAARALQGGEGERRLWLSNGGDATIRSYLELGETGFDAFLADLRRLFAVAAEWLVRDGVLFAHAARPNAAVLAGGQSGEGHLWARPADNTQPLPEAVSLSVHGHTPQRRPLLDERRGLAYLDLGGRGLAVLDLEAREVRLFAAPARRRG